jgi:hypothetical protein
MRDLGLWGCYLMLLGLLTLFANIFYIPEVPGYGKRRPKRQHDPRETPSHLSRAAKILAACSATIGVSGMCFLATSVASIRTPAAAPLLVHRANQLGAPRRDGASITLHTAAAAALAPYYSYTLTSAGTSSFTLHAQGAPITCISYSMSTTRWSWTPGICQ